MADVQIVFSSDDNYFLLAKGLVLSIEKTGALRTGFELAFIDLGCTPAQIEWFQSRGIRVVPFDETLIGPLVHFAPGGLRALILRPFLPLIFPNTGAIIWLDSDLWLQNGDTLQLFGSMALAHADKLFICPEWHYSYLELNTHLDDYRRDYFDVYYRTLYGDESAKQMGGRPMLNAGIFAMGASNPLWEFWKQELNVLYRRQYGADDANIRRLAEQIALNVLATRHDAAVLVDPLFNYSCLWALPFRDTAGVVRVPLPPNAPLSVVHLPLWKHRRHTYVGHGLLHDGGRYLTDEEKSLLLR